MRFECIQLRVDDVRQRTDVKDEQSAKLAVQLCEWKVGGYSKGLLKAEHNVSIPNEIGWKMIAEAVKGVSNMDDAVAKLLNYPKCVTCFSCSPPDKVFVDIMNIVSSVELSLQMNVTFIITVTTEKVHVRSICTFA